MARHPCLDPRKLRCIDGGQLYDREMYVAAVVNEFGSERFRKSLHGVFGSAVGGLQRDGTIGQG